MAQPADQLVGRGAELGILEDLLTELPRPRSAALALVGEPGIGKTRLLTDLGRRAAHRGYTVLFGSASEFERELPFGVFVDALDDFAEELDPTLLRSLEDETRLQLGYVLPSLSAGAGADGELGLHTERFRVHRAVRRLLEALGQRRPLVLGLDDLHWADSGSLELIGALLRRPPAAAVLIALGIRPRQLPERLSAAFERASRSGSVLRLELSPLSAEQSRAVLGPDVSRSVAAALHEESGGNPFYLEQLARALERRLDGMPRADALSVTGVEVPPMVSAALAEELAALSPGARRMLDGAAVAGDPFEPELAAAAADMPEAAAMDGLDALLLVDLVRPTEVPRRFAFRHPLVRQAVYEATRAGWRLQAHERCADALAARGAPAPLRAHHVEQAARHGDAAAIAVLREAGEAVAQRAPAGAARWFGAALRLLPPGTPPEERIALLSALAAAQTATGQFDEARDALLEALAAVPGDAVAGRIELASRCAHVEQLLGRHDDARARLTATLKSLEDPASREAAGLMVTLAVAAFFRLEFDATCGWAERAEAVARPLGDTATTAAAVAVRALGSTMGGRRADGDRYATEAAELLDAMPDDVLSSRLDAAAHLAVTESYLERFDAALAHGRRAYRLARHTRQSELVPVLIPALNTVMLAHGRIREGIELLDGAVESSRLSGNTQALAFNLFNRACLGVLAGELDEACTLAEESVELAAGLEASVISAWAGVILGIACVDAGDAERGVTTMMGAAGGEELPLIGGGWRAWCLEALTRGQLALGRRTAAERAAAAAAAVAAASGLRHPAALARRAAAHLALDAGDSTGALELALDSAAAADEIGARMEAAVSRLVAGRALARAGDTERAAALLERASAVLEDCGASRRRDEAEYELGRLGRRRHRRSRPGRAGAIGVDSLTERELQVARLIVDRRTNAEIAAELFLSLKTVETHVRNLFHKLDVSSRVDVARVVERAERARSAPPA